MNRTASPRTASVRRRPSIVTRLHAWLRGPDSLSRAPARATPRACPARRAHRPTLELLEDRLPPGDLFGALWSALGAAAASGPTDPDSGDNLSPPNYAVAAADDSATPGAGLDVAPWQTTTATSAAPSDSGSLSAAPPFTMTLDPLSPDSLFDFGLGDANPSGASPGRGAGAPAPSAGSALAGAGAQPGTAGDGGLATATPGGSFSLAPVPTSDSAGALLPGGPSAGGTSTRQLSTTARPSQPATATAEAVASSPPSGPGATPSPAAPPAETFPTGALLVQVAPGATGAAAQVRALAQANGATVAATGANGLCRVQGDAALLTRLQTAYSSQPYVQYAEPEQRVSATFTPNDPQFAADQSHLKTPPGGIDATTAWNTITNTLPSHQLIAQLDTGVNLLHEDTADNIWINQAEIPTIPFTTAFDVANGYALGSSRRSILTDVDGDGLFTFYDLNNVANKGTGKAISDQNGNGRIDAGDILTAMSTTTTPQPGQPVVPLYDNGTGGWAYPGNTQDGDLAHPNDFVGWNFVAGNNNPMDDNGHGTATFGPMAEEGNNSIGGTGLVMRTQVMVLKVLDNTGQGPDSTIKAATDYMVNGHHPVPVVSNNSYGESAGSATLAAAVTEVTNAGQVFVAAAGNNAQNSDEVPFFPAAYSVSDPASGNLPDPSVISVGASDGSGNRASFSNFGPTSVQVFAPGVNIFTTAMGGGYTTGSGTSFAAPSVAGDVALIRANHPTWPTQQVVDQVLDNTTQVSSLYGLSTTNGVLDAGASVTDAAGPKIVARSPAGIQYKPTSGVSDLFVTFNEEVNPSTFTTNDVISFTGPSGSLIGSVGTPTVVPGSNNHQFDIPISPKVTATGLYTMVIGPRGTGTDIHDFSGNLMDQDRSGTSGDDPDDGSDPADDQFSTTFTLVGAAQYESRYSFGTATSPLADTYTKVTEGTTYGQAGQAAGERFGWLAPQNAGPGNLISSADRGVPNALTRAFNFTPDRSFAVDVPSSQTYTVTATFGDSQFAHDQVGVFLNGYQVDTVTTAAGQFLTRSYTTDVGSGGLLLLRLYDQGGTDPNAVIDTVVIDATTGDTTSPLVSAVTPAQFPDGHFSQINVAFNEPILGSSISTAAFTLTLPSSATIHPISAVQVSPARIELTFPSQTATGTYMLQVASTITDVAGNALAANSKTFSVPAAPTSFAFAFRDPTSTAVSGYTTVLATTAFSGAQGYGWQTGSIDSRDRGLAGDPLTSAFNFSTDGTFAVNVPNGMYNVTVTMGDASYAQGAMGVYLQGTQVDSFTTAANQFVTKTYTATVSGGQLDLRLVGMGPTSPFAVINGLTVMPFVPPLDKFAFRDPTSTAVSGYTTVLPTTLYNPGAGQHHGWQTGSIDSRDRGLAGDPLTSAFNFTTDGTFEDDVPSGTYNVTVTMGDASYAQGAMGVYLQGTQVDSFTAAANQFVTRTYTAAVSSGTLVLRLVGMGPTSPFAVINGLVVTPVPAVVDTTGPQVTSAVFSGTGAGPNFNQVTVTFNEPIEAGDGTGGTTTSFPVTQAVLTLTDGTTKINPNAVEQLSATQYLLTFPTETTLGTYTLEVGRSISNATPMITDLVGNPMNQNGNGVNGEPGDSPGGDTYATTVTLATVPRFFDFGTPTSPVAGPPSFPNQYTQVTQSTTYSSVLGYGWQSGSIDSRDRGGPDDLRRDFNFTTDGVFAADVGAGTYTVTVTIGDQLYGHGATGVFLQGQQVDSVTTAANQFVTNTYTGIVVGANGELQLELKHLGSGGDPNAVIDGLTIM